MAKHSTAPAGTLGLMRVMEEFQRLDENMPMVQGLIFLFIASNTGRPIGPGVQEIAQALSLSESRVSRNLVLLEEAGLISKDRDPNNARARPTAVTPAGFAFLERLTTLVGPNN